MVKKWLTAICMIVTVSMILTGCGGSADTALYEAAEEAAAPDAPRESAKATAAFATEDMADLAEGTSASYANGDGGSAPGVNENVKNTKTKLIRDMDLTIETKEFDAVMNRIQADIKALGGYAENLSVSGQKGRGLRYANLTARIPSEKLDAFVSGIEQNASITYRNESVRDVTLSYVDMDAHKQSLLAERERLLELMQSAEDMSDIITIEDRLTQIRYEIESLESQLRAIDNDVTYSTVTISLEEVEIMTEKKELTTWERICEEFSLNLRDTLDDAKELGIRFIVNLPAIIYRLILLAILGLVVYAIFRCTKGLRMKMAERKERRRIKKEAKMAAEEPALRAGTASETPNTNEGQKPNE